MGCFQTTPSVNDEDMEKYLNLVKHHFDTYTITKMHAMFYQLAPNGQMTCDQFRKYLEKLSLSNVIGDTTMVDIDAQAIRLFRGYDLNGDGEITFYEYLLYQEAVLFQSPRLLPILFSIMDRDRDGYLTSEDLICMIQGVEEAEHDEMIEVINLEVEGLWQFLIGSSEKTSISLETFEEAIKHCPALLEKFLNLV